MGALPLFRGHPVPRRQGVSPHEGGGRILRRLARARRGRHPHHPDQHLPGEQLQDRRGREGLGQRGLHHGHDHHTRIVHAHDRGRDDPRGGSAAQGGALREIGPPLPLQDRGARTTPGVEGGLPRDGAPSPAHVAPVRAVPGQPDHPGLHPRTLRRSEEKPAAPRRRGNRMGDDLADRPLGPGPRWRPRPRGREGLHQACALARRRQAEGWPLRQPPRRVPSLPDRRQLRVHGRRDRAIGPKPRRGSGAAPRPPLGMVAGKRDGAAGPRGLRRVDRLEPRQTAARGDCLDQGRSLPHQDRLAHRGARRRTDRGHGAQSQSLL